jgi:hypothetical protein
MTRRIPNIARQLTALAALLLALTVSAHAQEKIIISKTDVQAVLDSIDKALLKKDAAAVVANYASNAVITATILESGHKDTTRHGRDDYESTLRAGFTAFDNYSLQRKDTSIEIASDGKTAQCKSRLIEKFRFDGKMEQAISKESISFAIQDGKVLVTKDHDDTAIE